MSTIEELRERTDSFLKRPPNNLPVKAPAPGGLEAMGPTTQGDFSVFIPAHAERALGLASQFVSLANTVPGEKGLEAVLKEAEQTAATEDNDMVKHALMIFITHHPEGRRLPIPPLAERSPSQVLPRKRDE